ncbi:hypothetical protein K3495_g10630 [Podosphaera aphanis]|nr:hypothetical protein K3495_g10630 [Podosphaera aphanis]
MSVTPLHLEELLIPLLASLPAATISSEPPTALLPFLSPILRQRVQILSSLSSDPWIHLLCYNEENIPKLKASILTSKLDPHPASGLVELDWETESQVQFKRVDAETLQALVVVHSLNLAIKLVWCTNDATGNGGSSGWRIGEIESYKSQHLAWGSLSLPCAEEIFRRAEGWEASNSSKVPLAQAVEAETEVDDDKYWAQYEKTSAQSCTGTPAHGSQQSSPLGSPSKDEAYYARYASIQPALDNDGPTEAHALDIIEGALSPEHPANGLGLHLSQTAGISQVHHSDEAPAVTTGESLIPNTTIPIQCSRRGSDISSQRKSTFGELSLPSHSSLDSKSAVKLHISTSLRSLFRLACATELEGEFDQIVRSELDALNRINHPN